VNELALFAGAGGGILGGHLLGWRTVCAVEWEQYPASVLCARQNDKILPPFPIWDDVQTFDGNPWRGIVDVVSGGFPCQDISSAGKGAGIEGNKSSMWKHMARIIGEVRPQYVFVENSPMLTSRGLGVVLADLSSLGFNAKWGVVSAADIGANHQRERIWIRAKKNVVDTQSCGSRRITGEFQAQNEQQTTKRQERRVWQSDYASEMVVPNVHGCVATKNTESTQETTRQQQARSSNTFNITGTSNISTTESNVAYTNQQFWRPDEIKKRTGQICGESIGNSGLDGTSKMAYTSITGSQREQRQEQHGGGAGFANQSQNVPNTNSERGCLRQTNGQNAENAGQSPRCATRPEWWHFEPELGRVAHGVAARVHRLKAIGNGQVPLCAATAWELLK
jgi:DNA (cytosine-5)-methyltransferase 1